MGSKETDDSANTCISKNGNARACGNAGAIEYYATTTTEEYFLYTNGSSLLANALAKLSPDKIRLYKTIRPVNANYENEGQQSPHSTLTNVGGTVLSGYLSL